MKSQEMKTIILLTWRPTLAWNRASERVDTGINKRPVSGLWLILWNKYLSLKSWAPVQVTVKSKLVRTSRLNVWGLDVLPQLLTRKRVQQRWWLRRGKPPQRRQWAASRLQHSTVGQTPSWALFPSHFYLIFGIGYYLEYKWIILETVMKLISGFLCSPWPQDKNLPVLRHFTTWFGTVGTIRVGKEPCLIPRDLLELEHLPSLVMHQ